MSKPKTPSSYGPPEPFPRKSLESGLADAILSPAENRAFRQQLHWEFDQRADSRNKTLNKALQMLLKALKPEA